MQNKAFLPASLSTAKEMVPVIPPAKLPHPFFVSPEGKGKVVKGFPNCQKLDPMAIFNIQPTET